MAGKGNPKGVPYKFDRDARERFLQLYEEIGALYASAKGAGVSSTTVYRCRAENSVFAELMDEAKGIYRDSVGAEVRRRGIEGWEEPVYQMGAEVGRVRKYSDRMLELEAKRHEPEYRDKQQVDMKHSGGVLVVGQAPSDSKDWVVAWQSLQTDVAPAGDDPATAKKTKRG